MELGLKNKVAIVGGGSMGIGYGIADRLAGEGANLVIFARRVPKLEAAAKTLSEKHGVKVIPLFSRRQWGWCSCGNDGRTSVTRSGRGRCRNGTECGHSRT